MRKRLSLLMAVILICALTACGGVTPGEEPDRVPPAPADETPEPPVPQKTPEPEKTPEPAETGEPGKPDGPEKPGEPEKTPEPAEKDPAQGFLGEWLCGGILIEITRREGEGYLCLVDRLDGDFGSTLWEYECKFDGSGLTCAAAGIKTSVTRDENGVIASRKVDYDDGYAIFNLSEAGKLVWSDFKELAGFGMEFERTGD